MPRLIHKERDRIIIDENIILTILEIRETSIRIGVQAPDETPIFHMETLASNPTHPGNAAWNPSPICSKNEQC